METFIFTYVFLSIVVIAILLFYICCENTKSSRRIQEVKEALVKFGKAEYEFNKKTGSTTLVATGEAKFVQEILDAATWEDRST